MVPCGCFVVVAGDVPEGGGDVGVAGLAVDADGEVAEADHCARQATGADLGVVFAVGALADAREEVLDALVLEPDFDVCPVQRPN